MRSFVKERSKPKPGSIPALLGMFERELRFYREVAPHLGVRVPACYEAAETEGGYRLVLEDLSSWRRGAEPAQLASILADLHGSWEGKARQRWPWLERSTCAAAEIGRLYDGTWTAVRERPDTTTAVRHAGDRFVGRVEALEREETTFGRLTLIHGDASRQNVRSSSAGEIALVDWEDVRLGSGAIDLTWFLVSSVDPPQWDAVVDVYAPDDADFQRALPYALTQGILTLSHHKVGSSEAVGWAARLDEAACRLI